MRTNPRLVFWLITSFIVVFSGCQQTPTSTPIETSSPPSLTFTPTGPTETALPQSTATSLPPAPATVPASVIEVKGAEVLPGFSIIQFASIYRPTAFAFDSQGRLY